MNILVPAIAAPMRITQGMWEDLLWDPVMAAAVLLGSHYDAFQAVRLRDYWFTPEFEDHSGNSTGKTKVMWDFCQLRALLIPDQRILVYYPTFDAGKAIFWPLYQESTSAIWRAHLGALEETEESTGQNKGPGCYTAHYRNGNKLEMPAPGMMKDGSSQAGRRSNTMIIDEYTQVDKMGNAIDDQLKNRNTRESWNKNHPLWCNHLILSGAAETQSHPSWHRHLDLHKRWHDHGDPMVGTKGWCYKDWSNLRSDNGKGKPFKDRFKEDRTMQSSKSKSDKATWKGKGLGIWSQSGEGWFTEQAIDRAQQFAREARLMPMASR